jgi:hypothetical protein
MADDKEKKEKEEKPKAVQGSDGVHGRHHSFEAGTAKSAGYKGKHRGNGDVIPLKKKRT